MILVPLTDEQVAWCREEAERWHHRNIGSPRTRAFDERGPGFTYYVGVLGEKAYSLYTGWPVKYLEPGGNTDDGTDFPGGVQVKSSCLHKRPKLMIPVEDYEVKVCKSYVLGWVDDVNHGIVYLCGAIPRSKFTKIKRKEMHKTETWVCTTMHLGPLHHVIPPQFLHPSTPRLQAYVP